MRRPPRSTLFPTRRSSDLCNMRVDVRRGEVVRHLARDEYDVNDSWLCDKGRYAYRFPDAAERITTPLIDRKSTRLNSSHSQISYAVFCLKKKNTIWLHR